MHEGSSSKKFDASRKEALVSKYENKDKLSKNGDDRAAYIFCKYTKSNIAKFCNMKDTKQLRKIKV